MEIKVGSKWENINGGHVVIVDEIRNERVIYRFEKDFGLWRYCHINTLLEDFKPLEFKPEELDIILKRNGNYKIISSRLRTKKGSCLQVNEISWFNDDLTSNKGGCKHDIMKVWRLSDISIKRTLEEQIKNVEPIWVREEGPKTIFNLEYGNKYYYKGATGNVLDTKWAGSYEDKKLLELGNVFLTKEECNFSIEEDKVRAIMRKHACTDKEWLNDDDNLKYTIVRCDNGKRITVSMYCSLSESEFSYRTREIAQQVIDEIGEERLLKYYFKVK